MISKEKIITWNFIFFILVSFYVMGAGFVESLVNYPLWHIIGPSDVWVKYHKAFGPRIVTVLAVPALLLQLITNILLFYFRPVSISKLTVWGTLVLLLIVVISSATIQIPIQIKLDGGYSRALVDRLIKSDLIFRVAVGFLRNCLLIYMLYCLFQKSDFAGKRYSKQNKESYKNPGWEKRYRVEGF